MVLAKVSIELIAIYFYSFEIFIIQIGEKPFCKPEFIIIKLNYFQNVQKGECFLDDFEELVPEIDALVLKIIQKTFAQVRERRFGALVLQNGLRPHSSARTSISRTTMRLRNVILKVMSSKSY
jgi:hypothetical protein